jgi:pyruvate formate lyase activating enzyme
LISEDEVLSFLKKRKNMLDGIVLSGGEPLIQKDIIDFLKKAKKIDYLIKIDTNGAYPEKLKDIIDKKLVDYVAMDVKAPKKKYSKLTGVKTDISKIEKSIDIIMNNMENYEFRTTIIPNLITRKDIIDIAKWIKGSKQYFLQQFKIDSPLISSDLNKVKPYSKDELMDILEEIRPYFKNCDIRGV